MAVVGVEGGAGEGLQDLPGFHVADREAYGAGASGVRVDFGLVDPVLGGRFADAQFRGVACGGAFPVEKLLDGFFCGGFCQGLHAGVNGGDGGVDGFVGGGRVLGSSPCQQEEAPGVDFQRHVRDGGFSRFHFGEAFPGFDDAVAGWQFGAACQGSEDAVDVSGDASGGRGGEDDVPGVGVEGVFGGGVCPARKAGEVLVEDVGVLFAQKPEVGDVGDGRFIAQFGVDGDDEGSGTGELFGGGVQGVGGLDGGRGSDFVGWGNVCPNGYEGKESRCGAPLESPCGDLPEGAVVAHAEKVVGGRSQHEEEGGEDAAEDEDAGVVVNDFLDFFFLVEGEEDGGAAGKGEKAAGAVQEPRGGQEVTCRYFHAAVWE